MTKPTEAQPQTQTQAQADILPDPIDDSRPDAADTQAPAEAEAAPAAEKPATVRPRGDETRDSIAAKFRALRDQKQRGEHAAAEALDDDDRPDAPDEPEPSNEPARTDSRPATPQAAPKAPAAQPQQSANKDAQEPDVILIVDGKPKRVSQTEAIRLAQIAAASDNRLEEAKRILAEAKGIKAAAPSHQRAATDAPSEPDPSTTGKDAAPANQRGTDLDPGKLDAIVERIQIGDKAEGAEALRELVEMVRPSTPPDEIERIVDRRLTATKTQEDVSGAVERFSQKYSTLVANPLLVDASKTALREEIARDILALGIPESDLAPIRNNEVALAQTVRALRESGLPVRTYDQLLDAVGQTMTQTFNIPAPPPTPSRSNPQPPAQRQNDAARDRLDRKRAAPQQPRAAGIRADAPREAAPKTKQQIVAEMRSARGFRNV